MNIFKTMFRDELATIREIHDSFDNAQDDLLKQALDIINQHEPQLSNKAERLEVLGFISSKLVVKNKDKKITVLTSKIDADLVNYYKQTYPFQKFLKESQLNEICNKYNLIYAPVGRYKEDVPEKNIKEIENAKEIVSGDSGEAIYTLNNINDGGKRLLELLGKNTPEFTETEKALLMRKHYGYNAWEMDESTWFSVMGQKFGINIATFKSISKTNKEGLFIAAPKSHFNLKGLKNKGLGFLNLTITEVKDPIVFRYVRGGIQVLSKWGLEASDEELQNEILN